MTGQPGDLARCELCPRRCGVDRLSGATGFCGAGPDVRVYRWGLHDGEEPPISGTRGSGTVFFSHCTLGCLYCQNFRWSQERRCADLDAPALARIFQDLASRGAHNLNLVTPTMWLPQIAEAADIAGALGVHLPFVYNTSGFERIQVVEQYVRLMDVVLTDLRYANPATAAAASASAHYVEASRAFAEWAWRRIGPLETDSEGIARRGVICRILVLPGRADEACETLEWLARTLGTEVHVSVMSQYAPVHRAPTTPGWDRPVTREEYERVTDRLEALGFENGWTQEYGSETPETLHGWQMPEGGGIPAPTELPPHHTVS
jgi:putative pyruvate formate lyase activating enzyme